MTSESIVRCIVSIALAASLVLSHSFAQNLSRVAPRVVPSVPVPVTAASSAPPSGNAKEAASTAAATVVIPVLKGVTFVSTADAIRASGSETAGISVGQIDMLRRPEFRSQMKPYLGHALTLQTLNDLTRAVVAFYRDHNHPLVNVTVPQQDVSSGIIQVLVTEYRVGQVRAQGNKWFSSRIVTAPVDLNHGDTIDSRRLLQELDTANANPFRRVDLLYAPSADPGFTDIILQTADRFPVRVYSSFDNSGTPITGRDRWSLGVNWGNALWHDQQFGYQFTSSSNFWTGRSTASGEPGGASFVGHSFSWSAPVTSRSSVSLLGAYEQSVPNVGQDLGLVGRSGQVSVRYAVTLPRTSRFTQSVQVGYDFKTTNNNLDFGGAIVSHNSVDISQFPVSYTAGLTDRWGITSATSTLVVSPGGLTPGNTDAAFQPADGQSGQPFATANYVYSRSEITRLNRLRAGAAWFTRVIAQVSDAPLLNTEQIAAGGADTLRGYDPYALIADQGVVLTNELRSPVFSRPGKSDRESFLLGQTQLLAFWDYASLHNRHPGEYVPANIDGSSIGVGARYSLRSDASLRFDYGWQLQRMPAGASGVPARGQLANISVTLGN